MKRNNRQLFLKISAWLITEIVLNLVGLDDLANYGEFLSGQINQAIATSMGLPSLIWHNNPSNTTFLT